MYKSFSLALVLLFAASIGISQSPTVSPTATPNSTDEEVVKISTNLVQLDFTVTDKDGHAIRDIKPGEVELYQNGKRQELSHFLFVANARETDRPTAKQAAQTAIPVVTPPVTNVTASSVGRVIALVVDDLNLSFQSTHYVQQALKKFVLEQMAEKDVVAIIRSSAGVGAFQQFTNDKRQLLAAIDKVLPA